jgi:hypothetical protein
MCTACLFKTSSFYLYKLKRAYKLFKTHPTSDFKIESGITSYLGVLLSFFFCLVNFLNIKAIYEQTSVFTTNGVIPARDAGIYVSLFSGSQYQVLR